jgi:C1A family cysteine protease
LSVIRKNTPDSGVELDLNQFSDWSLEQFGSVLGFKGNGTETDESIPDPEDSKSPRGRGLQSYPSSLNWHSLGAVTGVKNQGNCGSCYTFATQATMEGAFKIKYGTLKDFSE